MAVHVLSRAELLRTVAERLGADDIPPTDLNALELDSVLGVCVERLEWKQKTDARCREFALAITKLEEAQHWLEARRRRLAEARP